MADLFNKHLKKATARTKEKLLEGIGKAKATQDEVFDQHAANLVKQSKSCEKLQKDVKIYTAALKNLLSAEKQLRDTIREAYEPDWPDREQLTAIFDNLDIQTDELEKVVCEDLTQSVTQYVNQFPELKKKVEKRGRKLVDYDSAKNTFGSVKASSKKDNDPKLAKATSELQSAEQMYLEINNELLEILPAVYDSRITFFVDTLQTLFNSNSIYQTEASKYHKQIVTKLDTLGESMEYLRVPRPEVRALTPIDTSSIKSGGTEESDVAKRLSTPSALTSPSNPPTPKPRESIASIAANSTNPFDEEDDVEEKIEEKVYPKLNAQQSAAAKQAIAAAKRDLNDSKNPFDEDEEETDDVKKKVEIVVKNDDSDDDEEVKDFEKVKRENEQPTAPKPLEGVTNEKRKTLYYVIANHEYKAVDTDELSFSPGVKIKVLESNDSDQLDDGWLLGELENGNRGVFPENFTKKE